MANKHISKKESRSLDNVCFLIEKTLDGYDGEGNAIESVTETMRFCLERPVFSNTFEKYGVSGLKVEAILALHTEEYNEEQTVKYNEKTLSVLRVYPRDDGLTELYIGTKIGV